MSSESVLTPTTTPSVSQVGLWGNEPRLQDFEKHFYDEGGKPNARGFT